MSQRVRQEVLGGVAYKPGVLLSAELFTVTHVIEKSAQLGVAVRDDSQTAIIDGDQKLI